jgi:predicted Zn finger-like uncharacterized protein
MYTQCPECDVAFRVTADVLKQAAGKVRCGGCGIAFNALAHLSEEMPGTPADDEPQVETEVVEADEPPELEAGTPPQAISAEQSAALLKTLDQLAGEDIRIEDTGVEWRVMEKDDDAVDAELADDPVPSIVREEMRFDDNTPLPDDFDLDAPIVPPPTPAVVDEPKEEPEIEDSQVDLVFGEPDEWEDLLGDLDEVVEAAEAAMDEQHEGEEDEKSEDELEPLDMDTQFALQAEELGLDVSGEHQVLVEEPDEEPDDEPEEEIASDTSIEEDLIAAAFEVEAAAREELEEELEGALEDVLEENKEEEIEVIDEINLDNVAPEELSRAGILDEDDYLETITEEDEEEVLDEILLEDSKEDQALQNEVFDEPEPIHYAEPEEVEVPEPTEEEMTVNMAIDQELLAIAVEDDDGFTSTIVQKQLPDSEDAPDKDEEAPDTGSSEEELIDEDESSDEVPVLPAGEDSPLMETIIMEGESVLNEEDQERLAAAREAASESLKKAGFDEPKSNFRDWRPPKYSMGATAAVLFLILVVQVVHFSREALAISPAFQNTIGPVYRMVGSPVTPAWDIKGWRFEATKGSTNEEGDVLTIYSRIGNNSQQTLPYPLVHVSLTDRFEEIIGSRVLEPSEYLADETDPSVTVAPKESFNAVIAINSPSDDATGFKLNVCYRLASGQLRCADKDFR